MAAASAFVVNVVQAAWRPGEEGGTAIVNLLMGDVNPSGKLAQAWQRSAGYIHTPTSPWFQIHSDMISVLPSLVPHFKLGRSLVRDRAIVFHNSKVVVTLVGLPRALTLATAMTRHSRRSFRSRTVCSPPSY